MRLPLIFGCAALSGLLLSAQVFAQDSIPLFGDKTPDIVNPARSVSQLINRGKYADAMNLADKELAANPQNVNLRFLRGVIFMETKKNDEAKKVFEQLIREYPEIADSYNNLAVIYAGEGNLGRAQDLLERALMNNASSVTTYSNLGDIYAAKAADMYARAARLAPKNSNCSGSDDSNRSLIYSLLQAFSCRMFFRI